MSSAGTDVDVLSREAVAFVDRGAEAKDVFAQAAFGDDLAEFTSLAAYDRLP